MSPDLKMPGLQRSRIHPFIAAAAIAVIVVSGIGVAAILGILPNSKAVPAAVIAPSSAGGQTGATVSEQGHTPQSQNFGPGRSAPRPHHNPPLEQGYGVPAPSRLSQGTQFSTVPSIDPNAGQIIAINPISTAEPTTGLGALGGAVVGGLAGTQIGNGRGRTAATIVGALGGGLAGNSIEHTVHKATSYEVHVKMDDGSARSFAYQLEPGFQIGQRVRVAGGTLSAS